MKNTFKIFGLMLLAGTLVLSGCKKTDDDTPGVNPETGKTQYTITVTANNDAMGTVSGSGTYDEGDTVRIAATANAGFKFVNWNDNNTDNPRSIIVTSNANYMANFAELPFQGAEVTANTNDVWTPGLVGAGMSNGKFITILFENYENKPNTRTVYIQGGQATGTFTNQGQSPDYYWFYNHLKETCTINGSSYPSWMTDTLTQTITAIDMNAKTYTFTAEGELYNADEYFNNNGNVVTMTLSTRVNTEWTTLNFSKGILKTLKR